MDTDSIPLLCIMIALIAFSGFFSASETAFSTMNRIKVKNMAQAGNRTAECALALAEDYDRLISTILVGNNIVNIALASIGTVFFTLFFPENGVSISSIVITVVVLIFGEVSPKSLAKEAPEAFVLVATPFLRVILLVLAPINMVFTLWKKLLLKIFKIKGSNIVTEEELLTIVEEAESVGGIDEDEGEIIRSAIEFNDLSAQDILTPRVDVTALSMNSDREEITACFMESGFSRIPVYEESIDNIVGVLNQKDYYEKVLYGDGDIKDAVGSVIHITQTVKIGDLLKIFQEEKVHMAVVTDEYGGTAGIITLEDVLEQLVGEIWDEHDEVQEDIRQVGEADYIVSCNTAIDKFIETFALTCETDAATVSGWVTEQIGKIPAEGECFNCERLDVTVTKTETTRVLEIAVHVMPEEENDETEGE